MILDRTYEMAQNPPSPLAWEDYEADLCSEWRRLLSADKQSDERTFQAFLEQHPCMVPFPFSPGLPSGHNPLWAALITQPVLPDFHYKKPDFMWLATDSMCLYPILVEIEAPSKSWFTKRGQPTATLTRAMQQLTEWRTWFNEPVNVEKFKEYYHVERSMLQTRGFSPVYVLVYGRREEATRESSLAKQRRNMQRDHEFFMTYDRLSPGRNADQLWTIKGSPDHWEAVSIPPTTKLSPWLAERRACIGNREEAIRSNPLISKERAAFLIDRLAYWDKWAHGQGPKTMKGGDWE